MAAVEALNEIIEIPKADLLPRVDEMKHKNRRLSQAQASYFGGKYELLYSFADDDTYDYTSLKVVVDPEEHVPSITAIYPYANFYESEMTELYGVKIDMIDGDYHDHLYRIKVKAPFGPKEKEEKK